MAFFCFEDLLDNVMGGANIADFLGTGIPTKRKKYNFVLINSYYEDHNNSPK